jgi:hypothetical protein
VLVADDGTVVQGSGKIKDWAKANPPAANRAGPVSGETGAAAAGSLKADE